MYRYIGNSLDTDEAMSPREKALKNEFLSKQNTLLLFESAQRHVDPNTSYSNVVDAMHNEFTVGLGGAVLLTLSFLNQTTIDKLSISHEKHMEAMRRSREVGFEKSKIPSKMLPRPSFNLEEDDETRGKHQLILR